jgi:hypothetical protein
MAEDCGCNEDCGCDGMPKGEKGDAGQPSILALSFINNGIPITNATNSFLELGRFPFSNTIADPFTALKFNVWVSGGTGTFQIRDLISGNVVYINSNVISTSPINIETITGLDIYDVANALLVVEFKATPAANINAGGISFYYE